MVMVMVWDMPGMDMVSVLLMLNQKLMLSMELMDMVDMVLDTVLTLLDMDMDMVLDMDTLPLDMVMAMVMVMASMDKQQVELFKGLKSVTPLSTTQCTFLSCRSKFS